MEPHLQHTQGHHYDANALTAGHLTGHDLNEDEHHGEKKSVIKKVKEKAKKLKNTITKHGHDHHHEDDDDEEIERDPEVHGAPMYDSGLGGPDAILAHPRGNLEVMAYTEPVASHGVPPHGTNLSEPSGFGQEVIGKDPFAPNPTRVVSPFYSNDPTTGTRHVSDGNHGQDINQGGSRGTIGKDPHASGGSDPSNYETKVTNPTHTGGKEAQLEHSFHKMGIRDGPKSYHPENDTLTSNRSSTYAEKISTSASALADKAVAAIASKLGYSGETDTVKNSGSPATDKVVTGTFKVSGTGGQVHGGATVEKEEVSVKEYLAETLKPGEEDKALSDVITHAFHPEKKDKPMGTVTESAEVRQRLGTDHRQGNVTANKNVTERLSNALGSWFGDAPQGTLGTSYVTDEGLSSNPRGDHKR